MGALRCRARYKLQKSGNLRARPDGGLKECLSGICGYAADGSAGAECAIRPPLRRPEEEGAVSPDWPTQDAANLVFNSEGGPFAPTGERSAKPLIRHSSTLVEFTERGQNI